ncbi:XTP/dITP diphosphohydrolase [Hathewaya proteolytica DSM 3090]|uniref:dITP/XTP pyrophosphatase n=1 Tax=Hathewaya proteolytica DSM 3090 TaxID=1121331 RepID=A0A1M6NUC3_9CLOT|nr:XTP/dITP diphosphatase [Hathewaya proteolytica]SHJ99198.1 XTP/dITP diphosphohydrolase [Hathewaya proteolytica DSM 3090]
MRELIIASNNEGKIQEIKEILKEFEFNIKSLKEANIFIDVEETGKTFAENAYIKAKAIYDMTNECAVLADDSGLEVDYLSGEPGVLSARYAGEHGNDEKNNMKLIENMKGVPEELRTAKFLCHMVLILENGQVLESEGQVLGKILKELRGQGGFGYDPLFYVEKYGKTFAEFTLEEKDEISHRGRALEGLKKALKEYHENYIVK